MIFGMMEGREKERMLGIRILIIAHNAYKFQGCAQIYALKGELTHGKIKTSVVQMIEGSLNAEPTIAPESLQPLTYNENRDYIDCDEFICHKCGIHVEDWKQIKIDPDDGEKELCEYKFKHCPECGAKVTSHKSCEFCRWHLQDGTCFNKHHSQPVTGREASCWNWEERE